MRSRLHPSAMTSFPSDGHPKVHGCQVALTPWSASASVARTMVSMCSSTRRCAISEANSFLEAIEMRGLSRQTIRSYAYDLLLLYRWLFESDEKLCQLTAAKLVQFVASQRRNDAAPRSINRRLSTIRLLYRFHFGSDPGGEPSEPAGPALQGPGTRSQSRSSCAPQAPGAAAAREGITHPCRATQSRTRCERSSAS